MQIRIEATDLPGRWVGPEADALRRGNVHVGVPRRAEVVDRVPCDADAATWSFETVSMGVTLCSSSLRGRLMTARAPPAITAAPDLRGLPVRPDGRALELG